MALAGREAIRLEGRAQNEQTVTLGARVTLPASSVRLAYSTRTGALLRIDGAVAGAFDAKHPTCDIAALPGEHDIVLEVERRALPIAGLPSGDGLRWRLMLARATQQPRRTLTIAACPDALPSTGGPDVAVGHAHLDVAWLWTHAETKRKALRTFATAVREVEGGAFVFAQSQPQLYAWVEAADPHLFARLRTRVGRGWDASVATMWVEPDLHAPSGESVLRQFTYGMRYAARNLGPNRVWCGCRILWFSKLAAGVSGACRRDGVCDDETGVERHDALAVSAVYLARRRRQFACRRGACKLRRRSGSGARPDGRAPA